MRQPFSETAENFGKKFSQNFRAGIDGRQVCFRIFNFVSIDPGKIVKVIDCLKNVPFFIHFLPPRR